MKTDELCQVRGCMRRATHQPSLRVWPNGTPSNFSGRSLEVKLNVSAGICQRHGEALKIDDVMNEMVMATIEEGMRKRYNAEPDMSTAAITVRKINGAQQ